MKENIKYFETLNDANGYIINDIPFTCYIKENEQVIFNNEPNKMLIIEDGQAIIREAVNIVFETLADIDEYIIETIPFSCYIKENYQFLECKQENCKIVVENGVAIIKEMNDIIRYTATSKVTPYRPSSLPTIISNDFDPNTGKGVIKFETDVESIGEYAFQNCSGLTSVTIPNSVTSIGKYAFENCSSLTNDLIITNRVTSIGNGAFSWCSSLTSVTIPNSVTSIGANAFNYCHSLTSIIVENGNSIYDSRNNCNAIIETVSNMLIVGCQNTIIPNNIIRIGDSAFAYCHGLTAVTIPNSVTSIGANAFNYCHSLTSIEIPDSVTSIEFQAFTWCTNLASIEIPDSIASIGMYAFFGCNSLISISYTGTKAQYNSISKGNEWNRNVPATVVHCADGDTPI